MNIPPIPFTESMLADIFLAISIITGGFIGEFAFKIRLKTKYLLLFYTIGSLVVVSNKDNPAIWWLTVVFIISTLLGFFIGKFKESRINK